MKIRQAAPEDGQTLQELAAGISGTANWTLTAYSRAIASSQSSIVVAEEGTENAIAGFIVASFTGAECEIENLAVPSNHRRKGIASALLRALIADARERGIDRMLLEVRESNAAAIGFYLKAGFRRYGRRSQYYADPAEDALLLERKLQ